MYKAEQQYRILMCHESNGCCRKVRHAELPLSTNIHSHISSSSNGQANKQNVGKQTKTAFFVMCPTLGAVTRNAICVKARTL